jgi:preprotein translocase subunit SecF
VKILSETTIDFLKWRVHAIVLSSIVILAGVGYIAVRGLPLGIDFSGGTIVVVRFQQPVAEDAVRAALEPLGGEKVVQKYGDAAANEVLVRLPQIAREEGASLEQDSVQVVDLLKKANVGQFEVLSTEIVGPVIGRELQAKGIYATFASMAGILAYIALRFRFSFGVGAIVAVLHDVLVTLAFLAFTGYELSLNIVAALLTMTGYSVNDTIVIFDRVRENTRSLRRESLAEVVNKSVNQTLSRTIITAGTTALAVLSLFLFGGEVLRGFAFTMLIGIITGTYSTIFIAAAVAIWMSKGSIASGTATVAKTESAPASKRARKSKAS